MTDFLRRMDESQRPYLEEFRAFHAGLPEKRDLFYLFFTSGLLHWVVRTLATIPEGIHVVAISSRLTPEEKNWAALHLNCPFFHLGLDVDDKTIWEFLFEVSDANFGWLDVDCLVVEPGLFHEMVRVPSDALANTVWTNYGSANYRLLNTFFLFLNERLIRDVRARLPVSPCSYTYQASQAGRYPEWGFNRIVGPEIRERLASRLPLGPDGNPIFLSEPDYYDTLQVYQILAESYGYRLNHVRELFNSAPSSEIAHLGKVSYYESLLWTSTDDPEDLLAMYGLILQVDFLVLNGAVDRLPSLYRQKWVRLRQKLSYLNLPTTPRLVANSLRRYFAENQMQETALNSLFAAT